MMIDGRRIPNGTHLDADVCVVGSGIAGILTSLELSRNGREVLLLEAGGSRPEQLLVDAQRGETEGADHEGFEQTSTRRLGGALALWGGRLRPLDPEDFTPRNGRPQRWPIEFDDLSTHYVDAHAQMDAGAYEYDIETALRQTALPLVPAADASVQFRESQMWRWCPPLRYRHFRERLARNQHIRVVHHALVLELQHDPTGAVTSATASGSPGHTFSVRARTYVLAGGGMETTRLLLSSTTHRPNGLGNDHDQVGRNYMTHPVAEVGVLRVAPELAERMCAFETSHDGVYCRRFLSVLPDIRQRLGLLNMNITFWSPDPHDPSHGDGTLSAYALTKRFLITAGLTDKTAGAHRSHLERPAHVRAHAGNLARTAPATTRQMARWSRARWLGSRQIPALLSAGRTGTLRLRFDAEQRPEADNRVRLTGERDAYGMPRLRLEFRVGEADRNSYFETLRLLQRHVLNSGVGSLHLMDRSEFSELALGDGTHQMGLLRMSDTAASGVVDRNLRLHGSQNAYVVSTAVFPTAGAAPPTLTLAALALRLGQHLAAVRDDRR